jgi:hypothetical protein
MATTCKICGKILIRMFPNHLKTVHNLERQEYYDKYLKQSGDGECPTCKGPTGFMHWKRGLGYNKFCSHSCVLTDTNYRMFADPVRSKDWGLNGC